MSAEVLSLVALVVTSVVALAIFSLATIAIVAMVRDPDIANKALEILLGFWRIARK